MPVGDLQRASDGGILVDNDLQSSIPGIYAAGDCCTVNPAATAPHWFQMRLWTQARLMGVHAAASMAGLLDVEVFSFSFELVGRNGSERFSCAFSQSHTTLFACTAPSCRAAKLPSSGPALHLWF